MSLITCVKNDLDLWLKDNDNGDVFIFMGGGMIEKISNENCENFENVKVRFNDIHTIQYIKQQVVMLSMTKSMNKNITSISFVRLNKFLPGTFYPWIVICEDDITFNYIDCSNQMKTRSEVVNIKQIKSVRDFYEIAKSITLSYARDKYKKDIETYYDSLPLFESLAYSLEEICDFSQGDIIIEI